ncbi:MAG: hypothetical protein DRP01_10295 [Archaeoglobales archaeon]|nr:MAG: hypothetical protein DRP01_10295 [Archaeoglobales archaeon]
MDEVVKMVREGGEEWQKQREHIKGFLQHMIRNTEAFVEVTLDIDTAKGCTQYTMFQKALEFIASKSKDLEYRRNDFGYTILTVKLPAHIFKEYLEDRLADVITDARFLAEFLAGFKTLIALVSESKE